MSAAPIEALRTAFADRSRWVRLGAVAAAPYLARDQAAGLLAESLSTLDEKSSGDTAVLAVALARAGASDLALSLVSRLLQEDEGALREILNAPTGSPWAEELRRRAETLRLPAVSRILAGFYMAWHVSTRQRAPSPQEPWTDQERATYVRKKLRDWSEIITSGNNELLDPSADSIFDAAVEQVAAGEIMGGAARLVDVAVMHPNPFIRNIACHVLPEFGTDASPLLLTTVAGEGGPRPGQDVFNSIVEEAGGVRLRGVTSESLGAFLAADALEDFVDPGTARAVTSAALAWEGEPKLRVERVLAHMGADVAFPTLLWSALNLPQASDRRAAFALLERIVGRDETLGHIPLRIEQSEVNPGILHWVVDVAARLPNPHDWTADVDVALPIVHEAVRLARDITDEGAQRPYRMPRTAERATDFARSTPGPGVLQRMARRLSNLVRPSVTRLPRHPEIKFPARCHRGDEVTLSVQLLPAAGAGTAPPFDVPIGRDESSVELLVRVHSTGFAVTEEYRALRVPREGPSDTAVFHLRASENGQQVINIKFLVGTAEIGHCFVTSEVTEGATTGNAAVTTLEPITDESLYRNGVARAVLLVKTDRDRGVLVWTLVEPGVKPRSLGRSRNSFSTEQVETWSKKYAKLIREALGKSLDSKDMEGVLAGIIANGHQLFEEVAPPTLEDELAKIPDDQLVVIESDADWVPWELLAAHPAGPLLGQRLALVRSPLITELPKSAVSVPAEVSRTIDRALLVVGDKISDPSRLHVLTFGPYADRAKPPLDNASWEELRREVSGKDVVHFACHGRSEPTYHLSYGPKVGSRLYKHQAAVLGLKPGAVVFANACSSGLAEPLVAEFQGFGQQFYLAGARPYIGTLGPVPESHAVEFAAMFYTRFAHEGLPAGHALLFARRDAAAKFKAPTWLFYCMYGNASAVRRWSERL